MGRVVVSEAFVLIPGRAIIRGVGFPTPTAEGGLISDVFEPGIRVFVLVVLDSPTPVLATSDLVLTLATGVLGAELAPPTRPPLTLAVLLRVVVVVPAWTSLPGRGGRGVSP